MAPAPVSGELLRASLGATLSRSWRDRLEARVHELPARPRVPLCAGKARDCIGSLEPALAARMRNAGLPLRPGEPGEDWWLDGAVDDGLRGLAEWLRDQRLATRWRGELLDVHAISGAWVGRIERSAMRALGLVTRAVHLIGRDAAGAFWVQQRALDKATDPGLWDTLMGGLVSAGESIETTLRRETQEEAGLDVADLRKLSRVDRLEVRRPVDDGYMIEVLDVFEAEVPAELTPCNRDGEVERFERLPRPELLARLQEDAFTLEAAWILARALDRDAAR